MGHPAQSQYEKAEKETENDPNMQVVLVAVDDLEALRKAYPNYYVDTTEFLHSVNRDVGLKKKERPAVQI